jgi:hypothetical protein
VDLLNDATHVRRDVHGGFLSFERDERRFALDRITGLHEHIDDRDFGEAAHVGHAHVDQASHGRILISLRQ